MSRWLREPNLAHHFACAIASEPNLTVACNAPVISLAGEGGSVSGVTLAGGRSLPASRIVLANGTIEIARLLQLPYANASVPPWHASPWLGRGFMDHLDCRAGRIVPVDDRKFHAAFDNSYLGVLKNSPRLRRS